MLLALLGCGSTGPPDPVPTPWYTGYALQDTTDAPRDADGVKLFLHDGDPKYHPIVILNYTLGLLDNHTRTAHPGYLDLARRHVDRLLAEADTLDGILYFPYRYDFHLHGYEADSTLMVAPWYSGTAQAKALSVLARLAVAANDGSYIDAAKHVFPSLDPELPPGGRPRDLRCAEVDDDGYWIEMYPGPPRPSRVLNGHLYGLFGLWDFHAVTEDARALDLWEAGLRTVRENLDRFRRPREVSVYCLAHRVPNARYHRTVTRQLGELHTLTSESFFGEAARNFLADAP